VVKSFLDIHLFWAGKGAFCVLTQGYYGLVISAYVSFVGQVKEPILVCMLMLRYIRMPS
jgi:hypothetical protein